MQNEPLQIPTPLIHATLELCAAPNQFKVQYAVIGGIAAGYRTHPRFTRDLDVDQPIRIASAEGLILLKLLAFRSQDLTDIENLVAAQGDTLDLDWIRTEWQTVTSLDDPRMRRFMELVGDKTV